MTFLHFCVFVCDVSSAPSAAYIESRVSLVPRDLRLVFKDQCPIKLVSAWSPCLENGRLACNTGHIKTATEILWASKQLFACSVITLTLLASTALQMVRVFSLLEMTNFLSMCWLHPMAVPWCISSCGSSLWLFVDWDNPLLSGSFLTAMLMACLMQIALSFACEHSAAFVILLILLFLLLHLVQLGLSLLGWGVEIFSKPTCWMCETHQTGVLSKRNLLLGTHLSVHARACGQAVKVRQWVWEWPVQVFVAIMGKSKVKVQKCYLRDHFIRSSTYA